MGAGAGDEIRVFSLKAKPFADALWCLGCGAGTFGVTGSRQEMAGERLQGAGVFLAGPRQALPSPAAAAAGPGCPVGCSHCSELGFSGEARPLCGFWLSQVLPCRLWQELLLLCSPQCVSGERSCTQRCLHRTLPASLRPLPSSTGCAGRNLLTAQTAPQEKGKGKRVFWGLVAWMNIP